MKIAFLSSLNPYNINNWSGTLYYIFISLQKTHCVEWICGDVIEKAKKVHFSRNKNMPFIPELYSPYFAEIISGSLKRNEYEVIIAHDCFFIAHLQINIPIIYIGNSSFDLRKESWAISSENFIRLLDDIEKKALQKSNCIIYSSIWAKSIAISYYGIEPSKIHVVEFGANISKIPDMENTQVCAMNTCNLLFIGKDWDRKGVKKAYETYNLLKQKGFPCSLTIVGYDFDPDQYDSNIKVISYIDKVLERDAALFNQIMHETHFLFLPANFDCFGTVFCEASAYGVPSISADVGGVTQVVRNGKNGYLLSINATAQEYAELIESVFLDKKSYHNLRKSSRNEFETRLNWGIWEKRVNLILKQFDRQSNHDDFNDGSTFYIPTYVVNLINRTDRRKHIQNQFRDKSEFKIQFIEATKHSMGTIGLWESLRYVIQIAIENKDDIIVFCEDDHTFSNNYHKDALLRYILEAQKKDTELLLGGVSNFGIAVPTSQDLYWIDWYWGNQFIVFFQSIFQRILDYDFKETDMADLVLSGLTNKKMVIYPFISVQQEFGYSDINKLNETPGFVNNLFEKANKRLSIIHKVNLFYNYRYESKK